MPKKHWLWRIKHWELLEVDTYFPNISEVSHGGGVGCREWGRLIKGLSLVFQPFLFHADGRKERQESSLWLMFHG